MAFFRKKCFPALSGALWLCFLFLDLTQMADSTWVKFAAICLCWAVSLTALKSRDGNLVGSALSLTVMADWFLLVLDRSAGDLLWGVCLFLLVQALYAYRLYRWRGGKSSRAGLTVRMVSFFLLLLPLLATALLAAIFIIVFRDEPSSLPLRLLFAIVNGFIAASPFLLLVLPLFYFVNLCVNTAEAWGIKNAARAPADTAKPIPARSSALSGTPAPTPSKSPALSGTPAPAPSKSLALFAWGLSLFVCCDVCVGLWNLSVPLPPALLEFARVGMWLFYLPSQVLIVLSQCLEGEHV